MCNRFRWVECQLETLRKCFTVPSIRNALRELPTTLDDTYNRILNNIPEQYRREAYCILQLLAVSLHRVSVAEVAEAIAIDCENEIFDPENRLRDEEVVFEICSSLVTLSGCAIVTGVISNI